MTKIVLPEGRSDGRRGFEILLPNSAANGTFSVTEASVPAAIAGPPLHIHPASDETYYVLAGTMVFIVNNDVTEVEAGGLVHISRGTEHTYATRLDNGATFLTFHVPGGYEQYHLAALRAEEENGGSLGPAELFKVASKYDWQLAGSDILRLLPTGTLVQGALADGLAKEALEKFRADSA